MHPYVQIKIKIFQVFFLIQMSKGERQGWANRRGNTSDSEYSRLYANACVVDLLPSLDIWIFTI